MKPILLLLLLFLSQPYSSLATEKNDYTSDVSDICDLYQDERSLYRSCTYCDFKSEGLYEDFGECFEKEKEKLAQRPSSMERGQSPSLFSSLKSDYFYKDAACIECMIKEAPENFSLLDESSLTKPRANFLSSPFYQKNISFKIDLPELEDEDPFKNNPWVNLVTTLRRENLEKQDQDQICQTFRSYFQKENLSLSKEELFSEILESISLHGLHNNSCSFSPITPVEILETLNSRALLSDENLKTLKNLTENDTTLIPCYFTNSGKESSSLCDLFSVIEAINLHFKVAKKIAHGPYKKNEKIKFVFGQSQKGCSLFTIVDLAGQSSLFISYKNESFESKGKTRKDLILNIKKRD